MTWKNPFALGVALTVLCFLTTSFIKVPLPSRGYFNFGDVAVVFAGLFAGRHLTGRSQSIGAIAGGVGSALADVVGGYAMFAPITLIAKLLEGAAATAAARVGAATQVAFLLLGGALMVATYFIAEWFLPSFGPAGALAELLPNIVQAIGGAIGGLILFRILDMILRAEEA